MGRMEGLFYELYASSKRHDSWQRQAMIRELRNLLKQPLSMKMKGNRSDSMVNKIGIPLDQVLNDEELGETEVATDSIETEHETVNLVPEAPEEESIPQVQVPIANSEVARSIEPGKVDLGLENEEYVMLNENLEQEWVQKNISQRFEVDGDIERDQKMIRDAKICCAHQLFDQMTSKGKRSKYHKAWKFKFKRKSLVGIKLQIEQYKLSKRRRRLYNKLSTNIKDESMKVMIPGNHPRMLRQLHNSRVQSKMRMVNDSWSMRQPTLKIMKSHRKHKWKSKQLQIASNFWINHSHKMADLVLRTALTDWRTKNSKGLAYDGCVSLETNLAGFGRGKTEMLATSQKMQKMDLFSFGIYTEMEENVELKQLLVAMERFSQEVIEPKMEGGLICGDERFQIKHKWRFKLLLSILELEVDQLLRQFQELFEKLSLAEMKLRMIGRVWKSFGYLMEDMMEEYQKLQGESEPLLTVPDFAAKICETFDQYIRKKRPARADRESASNQPTLRFSPWVIEILLNHYMVLLLTPVAYAIHFLGGVGMAKKPFHLPLRSNRVWDPGG